jgi:hypothetical protein
MDKKSAYRVYRNKISFTKIDVAAMPKPAYWLTESEVDIKDLREKEVGEQETKKTEQ